MTTTITTTPDCASAGPPLLLPIIPPPQKPPPPSHRPPTGLEVRPSRVSRSNVPASSLRTCEVDRGNKSGPGV